jgi:hypothetical protein
VWGGDFVGLTAEFDAQSGQLIPVPEYLIPASFLEWGYPPSCLESIVSEHLNETNHAKAVATMGSRQTLTIYPAAGCDVDNLNTSPVQREEFQRLELVGMEQLNGPRLATDIVIAAAVAAAVTVLVPPSSTITSSSQKTSNGLLQQERLRMEACFAWIPPPPPPRLVQQSVGAESVVEASLYRTRVQVEATVGDQNLWTLVSPIRVSLERQISPASSGNGGGLVEQYASGGGLDGRTVSQWLGPILSKKDMQSFATQDMSTRKWKVPYDIREYAFNQAIRIPFMNLPGNVTVGFDPAASSKSADTPPDLQAPRPILRIGQLYPTMCFGHFVQFTIPAMLNDTSTARPTVISRIERGRLISP